ncbi:MAG: ATP-binding protein [Verrucomicrobia bacterium]|nr:ATP-binding protein [Verrucomicrobiota bacterium]
MRASVLVALGLLFPDPAGPVKAGLRPAGGDGFNARTWTADHGLPQNAVQALCQTRDGFLWVGTRFGLARFDGVEFRRFSASNVPELAEASVSALAEDVGGGLWVGTLGGLLRFDQGRFHRVPELEGRRVWAVWRAPTGELWLGLNEGLARWEPNLLEVFSPPPPFSGRVRSLVPLETGELLVTTLTEWLRFDLGSKTFHPWLPREWTEEGEATPPVKPDTVWRVEIPRAKSPADLAELVFSHGGRGNSGNTWGPRMIPDGHGGWWAVSADRKLIHLGSQGPRRLAPPREDVFSELLCALPDREGGLWLGTSVAGLTRLRLRYFEHFAFGEGEEAACFTVTAEPDGTVWAASKTRLLRWRAGQTELLPLPFASPMNQIFCVLPDATGGVWIAQDRVGLFRWRDGRLEDHSEPAGAAGTRLRVLARTRDGALWLGGRNGLSRWDGNAATRYGLENGLPHLDVRAVHEDRSGRLWVATFGGGVAWREATQFRALRAVHGLSHDIQWGFLEDRTGALWVYGLRGLNRLREGHLAVITREHGLFDDLTNQMIEDEAGDFWLGCNRGLYRVRGEDLHAVADGRQPSLECTVFGAGDGLPVAETNGENQPAGARAADGALWIPTPVGVVRVVPAQVPRREVPPTLHLEFARTESLALLADGRMNPALKRTKSDTIRVPPGAARVLEFRFAAPSFAAPERVRFRHRLVGYEREWVEAGSRRETHYTNLRPGAYRFEFTACNDHGVWNPDPVAFAFVLLPHFWQTPGFYALAAAILGAIGLGAHQWRVRLVRRRLRLERQLALARERERIARDMHDDVGAGLTQIGLLTARAAHPGGPAGEVGKLLDRIAETSRDTAQAMDEIVWAVNPRNDRLDHLANYVCQFAREYLEPSGIRCRLEVPSLLPAWPVSSTARHHLLMVLKEALANAVRHARATEITVSLGFAAGELRLVIADDGRGFSPAVPAAGQAPGGNGLVNLHRRAAALGARCHIHSRPGEGTCVELVVGLPGSPVRGMPPPEADGVA